MAGFMIGLDATVVTTALPTILPALAQQDARIADGQLAALDVPVLLIYGARDEYLSTDLARHLASLFGRAELHVVEGASHWPQADQPETVARILTDAR
jgi:pimeloyl-ACP methyl ester carboxylesterase